MGNDFKYTAHNTMSTASFYGIISMSTIPGGVFEAGWGDWVMLDGERGVWYLLFRFFKCNCQSQIY